jgi:HK97 gp10 family phage protein
MADSFNNFDQLANVLDTALAQAVSKTAFDGQANVQKHIQANDQVDTGFMLNSVYAKTKDTSTYKGGEKALPEVEAPSDDKTAYVAVAAEYAIYQDMGTRYMPGHPFFEPGMEETRQSFNDAIAVIKATLEGS